MVVEGLSDSVTVLVARELKEKPAGAPKNPTEPAVVLERPVQPVAPEASSAAPKPVAEARQLVGMGGKPLCITLRIDAAIHNAVMVLRAAAMREELKQPSRVENAGRVVFACASTAFVVISVYYLILWLVGAR